MLLHSVSAFEWGSICNIGGNIEWKYWVEFVEQNKKSNYANVFITRERK